MKNALVDATPPKFCHNRRAIFLRHLAYPKKHCPPVDLLLNIALPKDLGALPENIAQVKELGLLSMDVDQGRFVIEYTRSL